MRVIADVIRCSHGSEAVCARLAVMSRFVMRKSVHQVRGWNRNSGHKAGANRETAQRRSAGHHGKSTDCCTGRRGVTAASPESVNSSRPGRLALELLDLLLLLRPHPVDHLPYLRALHT